MRNDRLEMLMLIDKLKSFKKERLNQSIIYFVKADFLIFS